MNYKFLITFIATNIFSHSCFAVKMPSEEVLRERIKSIGMEFILSKTSLINDLANKEYEPEEVVLIVESELNKLSPIYGEEITAIINNDKVILIRVLLLQDNQNKFEEHLDIHMIILQNNPKKFKELDERLKNELEALESMKKRLDKLEMKN